MNLPKPLPRNEAGEVLKSFSTKKHNYTIVSPFENIGARRRHEIAKYGPVLHFANDFQSFWKELDDLENLQYADNPSATIKKETAFRLNALKEHSKEGQVESYGKWLQACAYFIFREDEDFAVFSKDLAMEKMNDWNAHFNESDFFLLANYFIRNSTAGLVAQNEAMKKNLKLLKESEFPNPN